MGGYVDRWPSFVTSPISKYLSKEFENFVALTWAQDTAKKKKIKSSLKVKYPFNSSLKRRAAAVDYHGGNSFLTLLPDSCDSPLMWLFGKPAFIFGLVRPVEGCLLLIAEFHALKSSHSSSSSSLHLLSLMALLVGFSAQWCSAAIQGPQHT